MAEPFVKHDAGKLRFDLFDPVFHKDVVGVLTDGAVKYSPENWKNGTRERYVAALGRHWNAYLCGEVNDPESGRSHLAHMTACSMFLHWMDRQKTSINVTTSTTWNVPLSVTSDG